MPWAILLTGSASTVYCEDCTGTTSRLLENTPGSSVPDSLIARSISIHSHCRTPIWLARLSVGLVFFLNVTCALQFVIWPSRYAGAFELEGVAGRTMVRGMGVLFLMWIATYPPVLWRPDTQRALFAVVLIQQAIGLAGETCLLAGLPAGHTQLRATGLRFILFDGAGLLLMSVAFGVLMACRRRASLRRVGQAGP